MEEHRRRRGVHHQHAVLAVRARGAGRARSAVRVSSRGGDRPVPLVSPRVTVILPTYNWATVLPYSIGSVLGQHFTDFELLVIGDGCTDESGEVVGAIDDPRVEWINLPQRTGYQSGPNTEGLRRARGSIVAYLGHDDLWLPSHLELMTAALDGGSTWAYALTLYVD